MLYQLSYTHHVRSENRPAEEKGTGSGRVLAPPFPRAPLRAVGRGSYSAGTTCFAAMLRAVSESGPGCGTKTASR
ncbi:hypothetical protein SSAG_04158 [Streptomyces sp. Mg1]|nr:hypothetical protein SSAG_04158 [Streptomyces sp. Mg1]